MSENHLRNRIIYEITDGFDFDELCNQEILDRFTKLLDERNTESKEWCHIQAKCVKGYPRRKPKWADVLEAYTYFYNNILPEVRNTLSFKSYN